MKKAYPVIIFFISLLLIIATAGISQAAVFGQCSMCHTMHNSQNGADEDPNGPNDFLAKGSCLGCHGQSGSTVGNAPSVFGTTINPTTGDMCAGGTFNSTIVDSAGDDNKKVHNVHDITWTNGEDILTAVVPGAVAGSLGKDIETIGIVANFSCAGTYGCHGDHAAGKTNSSKGIRGFHHGTSGAYRYCKLKSGSGNAIIGKGSADWEKGGGKDTNHNVYSADTTAGISAFCAECHGLYHGTTNTNASSPFKRHPTNNLLNVGVGWTMTSVTTDYVNNPFAFDGTDYTANDPNSAYVTSGGAVTNARVACVSCHRAHGTPYNDILRFDYDDQIAGGGTVSTGCLGCHHRQR